MADKKVTYTVSLNDLISKGLLTAKQAADSLNKSVKSISTGSGFGDISSFTNMFASITLGGLAVQGATMLFSSFTAELQEGIKASLEYNKVQELLKFSLRDMGDSGKIAFNELNAAATKSQLFSPTAILEAQRSLITMGDLTAAQVKEMMPLIEDYAATSQFFYGDVAGAAKAIAPAIETGMVRARDLKAAIVSTGGELKKGDSAKNYAALLKALGKSAGGAAVELGTLTGQIKQIDVIREKIQEGSNLGTAGKIESQAKLITTMLTNIFSVAGMVYDGITKASDKVQSATSDMSSNLIELSKNTKSYFDTVTDGSVTWASTMTKMADDVNGVTNATKDLTDAWKTFGSDVTAAEDKLANDIYLRNIGKLAAVPLADITDMQTKLATQKAVQAELDLYEGKEPANIKKANEVHGNAPTNINITIDDLIKEFNINTTTMKEAYGDVKEAVAKVLIGVVNDANLIPTH